MAFAIFAATSSESRLRLAGPSAATSRINRIAPFVPSAHAAIGRPQPPEWPIGRDLGDDLDKTTSGHLMGLDSFRTLTLATCCLGAGPHARIYCLRRVLASASRPSIMFQSRSLAS